MNLEKAKKIKIIITDVDGVLTDGLIGYGNYNDDYRFFSVHDGLGFLMLKKSGLYSAIITSKSSKAVERRAKELGINILSKNAKNKLKEFDKILKRFKLKPESACYIGDDLLDLPVLKNAGLSVTVPQASDEIKNRVDYITKKDAGRGAVREVIELILKAQDKWDSIVRYFSI